MLTDTPLMPSATSCGVDGTPPTVRRESTGDAAARLRSDAVVAAGSDEQSIPAGPPVADAATDRIEGETELASVFKLLADETRLRVLMALLREGESHVSGLCNRLDQSQPAVSHHLALLRQADILDVRRQGKHNFYSVRRPYFDTVMGSLFTTMVSPPVASA